jgi:ABC-2 type transport system ATP-binding protein
MPMSHHATVKVEAASYAFGQRQVLDGVSFTVAPGRVTLLLGPNGAGKTTLFSLIAGLLAPQSGSIVLPETGRAGLSIVFQQPALDLDMTVQQNLAYHGGLYGLTKLEIQLRLASLLPQLDLSTRLHDKVRNLNGGHRRRVEIVRALMTNPTLLLLDEPTAGLDAQTRKSLVDFLHIIAKARNMAMLWATHLTDEATPHDDVIVLHEGRVRASGSLESVIASVSATSLESAFMILTRKEAA